MSKLSHIKFNEAIAFRNAEKRFFSVTEFPSVKAEVTKDYIILHDGPQEIRSPMTTVTYLVYIKDEK